VTTGTQQVELRGHQNRIAAIGFSADGSRIATGAVSDAAQARSAPTSDVAEVKIWDAITGQELLSLKTPPRASGPGFGSSIFPGIADRQVEISSSAIRFPTARPTNESPSWEAPPLSANIAASELAYWFVNMPAGENLLTRAELIAYLAADQTLDDSTRALALEKAGLPMARRFVDRGTTAEDKGKLDAAMQAYDEAIRLSPSYAIPYNNRGHVWLGMGNMDRAMQDYNEAIRLDARYALAFHNRGMLRNHNGEFEKALHDFNESIRLDPNSRTINERAWLRATCPDANYRNAQQAIADATRACEMEDWLAPTFLNTLGAAYAESGDFASAIKCSSQGVPSPRLPNLSRACSFTARASRTANRH
jgi:Flp pilus assembly protein TadD